MNFSLWSWASWILRQQAAIPEFMRLGAIAIDAEGKYTFAQQGNAVKGLIDLAIAAEADAPVHIFGAGPDDDAEPTEVAALEAEAEKYGCSILTLLAVASLLKNLFGRDRQ